MHCPQMNLFTAFCTSGLLIVLCRAFDTLQPVSKLGSRLRDCVVHSRIHTHNLCLRHNLLCELFIILWGRFKGCNSTFRASFAVLSRRHTPTQALVMFREFRPKSEFAPVRTECTYCQLYMYTGLFEMIVGVLTTCHTQYTWDRSICIFFI